MDPGSESQKDHGQRPSVDQSDQPSMEPGSQPQEDPNQHSLVDQSDQPSIDHTVGLKKTMVSSLL